MFSLYFKNSRIFNKKNLLRLTGFIVFAIIWEMVSYILESPAMPSLIKIFKQLFALLCDGTLLKHTGASITIILNGLLIALVFGFFLGILLFRYNSLREAMLPIIEIVRGIAALTLFPLLIVLFGLGQAGRAFVIFWTAWPAILLSTLNSLNIDENIVKAARLDGASEWRILFNIRVPIAAQEILTGIRIGVGGGWVSLIAAEMLGAREGLGYYLLWSAQSFEFDKVYAAIITIGLIGGLMNFILLFIQKKSHKIIGGDRRKVK